VNNRILSPIIKVVKPKATTFKIESKRGLVKPNYAAIGNRIKEARKNAGLTQTELAEPLELSQPAINLIESGRVSLTLDNLFMISEVLGQPIEYFLGIGSGELMADEVEWLQLYKAIPPKDKPTIIELFRGYIERLMRKAA
jgi:transcriptional regulator with XRE-family HTH domain